VGRAIEAPTGGGLQGFPTAASHSSTTTCPISICVCMRVSIGATSRLLPFPTAAHSRQSSTYILASERPNDHQLPPFIKSNKTAQHHTAPHTSLSTKVVNPTAVDLPPTQQPSVSPSIPALLSIANGSSHELIPDLAKLSISSRLVPDGIRKRLGRYC